MDKKPPMSLSNQFNQTISEEDKILNQVLDDEEVEISDDEGEEEVTNYGKSTFWKTLEFGLTYVAPLTFVAFSFNRLTQNF